MASRRIGPYQLQALLGAGGMGEVYRARDPALGRDVAIKILPRGFARDPERLARFEREARLLASLNHPNIGTIYSVEDVDPSPGSGQAAERALILELVEGETLAERLVAGPLPVTETLTVARQIADALDAAHERGIVHRDLKPANIKITPGGVVKVLDFGLAKMWAGDRSGPDLSQSPTATLGGTRDGVVLGTAAYMSPEQARGKPVDKRADIWAFGCVLYEMLTGRLAFKGETISDTIAAILEREPDWQALPAKVPRGIRRLVRRCLDKDPQRRMRDIGDARVELDDALASRGTTADEIAAPRPRVRAVISGAVVLGLALGALGMWAISSRVARAISAEPRLARFTITLPSETVINQSFSRQEAISPDGTLIVYAGLHAGQRMLYSRRVDELEARPIEGTAGANGPFFSPDGQWLGFVRPGSSLMKLALSGGAPVPIAKNDAGFQGASWGPDGTVVFLNQALWRVPDSGGTPTELLNPDIARGERAYRSLAFLPGGKAIVFTVSMEDMTSFDDARIAVLNLETHEKKILIEGGMSARYSPSGHLVYARNGSLLAVPFDLATLRVTGQPFPVASGVFMSINSGFAEFDIAADGTLVYAPGPIEGGQRIPVWVDRQGHASPLPLPQRSYLHPSISADERQLAIEIEGVTHDLYTYDFARGALTQLTFDGMSHWPLWRPPGDQLTFRSYRTNAFTMWSMPADRSGHEARLTTIGANQSAASWTPDGQAVAFTQVNADTGPDVYVLSLDGDRKPVPFANSKFAEGSPKFSADGRWLAYSSTESGRAEIYAQPWPGPGPKIQISTDGGTDALWTKESGELFYRDGDKMMASRVSMRPTLAVSKPQLLWERHYSAGMGSSCGVPGPTSANYDVTADGKRFLMMQDKDQDVVARQLTVVLNWADALKRRAPTR